MAKSKLLILLLKKRSSENLREFPKARNEAKQMVRHCANVYWVELSQHIQNSFATGSIRAMYESIEIATGPTQSKSAFSISFSGELITDKGKQMDRWKEYYSNLYTKPSVFSVSALAERET